MATLFPKGFYDNTISKTKLNKNASTTLPLAKDIKQDLNTGKFILDDKNDFIIVTGIEAVIQMCRKRLLTRRQNREKTSGYIIYSEDFGSRLYLLVGKTKDSLDFYAEEYVLESLKECEYVTGIQDFQIEKISTGKYNLIFKVNTVYGIYEENMTVEGNI